METKDTELLVTKKYAIKGVQFDTFEEYISIRKHQSDFSVDTHVLYVKALESEHATPESEIRTMWDKVEPIEPKDAFRKYASNSQQLMTVMSIMGPEKTFNALDSEVFNKQTIKKVQKRTFLKSDSSVDFNSVKGSNNPNISSELFEIKEVEYDDTYTIHKIKKEVFGKNQTGEDVLENDVFVLEVECPSTHQHYFIFIDSTNEQCQDAIGAVAWTMVKDNGECLSKEEYLELQSEA